MSILNLPTADPHRYGQMFWNSTVPNISLG
jgi:hypothetical protein